MFYLCQTLISIEQKTRLGTFIILASLVQDELIGNISG